MATTVGLPTTVWNFVEPKFNVNIQRTVNDLEIGAVAVRLIFVLNSNKYRIRKGENWRHVMSMFAIQSVRTLKIGHARTQQPTAYNCLWENCCPPWTVLTSRTKRKALCNAFSNTNTQSRNIRLSSAFGCICLCVCLSVCNPWLIKVHFWCADKNLHLRNLQVKFVYRSHGSKRACFCPVLAPNFARLDLERSFLVCRNS